MKKEKRKVGRPVKSWTESDNSDQVSMKMRTLESQIFHEVRSGQGIPQLIHDRAGEIAKSLLNAPPKSSGEWHYMKGKGSKKKKNDRQNKEEYESSPIYTK